MNSSPLAEKLTELRRAVFETYAELRRAEAERLQRQSEHERRDAIVDEIVEETLEGRPLRSFSATHLEVLALLVSYWRELEVAADAELAAPAPLGLS